jgi:hypothetical protein
MLHNFNILLDCHSSHTLSETLVVAQLVNKFFTFPKIRISLEFSQNPATGLLHPEPVESGSHYNNLFFKIHLNVIIPYMPNFPKWSLPFMFSD